MTKIDNFGWEFADADTAEAYDQWYRRKAEVALNDTEPRFANIQVTAELRALIDNPSQTSWPEGVLIEWTTGARADAHAILKYIAERNMPVARDRLEDIERAASLAALSRDKFPGGRASGVHEVFASPNYVLLYRAMQDQVVVVSVMHTQQHFPD